MFLKSIFYLIVFIVFYLVWFFANEYNPMEKEMDWPSYLFAKTARWYLTNPFPLNTTDGLAAMRSFHDLAFTYPANDLITRYPEISTLNATSFDVKIDNHVTVRIYNGHQPSKMTKDHEKKPVLVWYHGGGMIIGSYLGAHGICLKFANYTGFVIVNVDYRLAPEYPFPTPLNDAYTAFLWVEDNIAKYGGDPNRLTIGGDSAGGYLATAVSARYLASHLEKEEKEKGCEVNMNTCESINLLPNSKLKGILAVYPMLNSTTESDEAKLYDHTSWMLTLDEIAWMRALYQGSPDIDMSIRSHYWFAPFNTPTEILRFFPPTIFVLARYDILTQESLLFQKKLDESGVKTELLWYGTTIHAFFGNDIIPAGNEAMFDSSMSLSKVVESR